MPRIASTLTALAALLCLAAFQAAPANAAGGAPAPTPSAPPPPQLSPEEQAAQLYNDGLALRDKAWETEKKAEAATGKEREKLEAKVHKQLEKAAKRFEAAVEKNPGLFQAHSSLGYALRRTGRYAEALEAYDRALALNPRYTEAVEYRAEAYLGLDRVEDAKGAYMTLFNQDKARASELLEAMKEWMEARRAEPAAVAPETVEGLATWIAERGSLAAQTGAGAAGSSAW